VGRQVGRFDCVVPKLPEVQLNGNPSGRVFTLPSSITTTFSSLQTHVLAQNFGSSSTPTPSCPLFSTERSRPPFLHSIRSENASRQFFFHPARSNNSRILHQDGSRSVSKFCSHPISAAAWYQTSVFRARRKGHPSHQAPYHRPASSMHTHFFYPNQVESTELTVAGCDLYHSQAWHQSPADPSFLTRGRGGGDSQAEDC
jgi:hypothetical protein